MRVNRQLCGKLPQQIFPQILPSCPTCCELLPAEGLGEKWVEGKKIVVPRELVKTSSRFGVAFSDRPCETDPCITHPTPYAMMCSSPHFGHRAGASDWLLCCDHRYAGHQGPLPKRGVRPGPSTHALRLKRISSSQRQRSRKQRGVRNMQKIKQEKKTWSINWLEATCSKGGKKER